MEGEAIVFHLVWKGRIASREVYHDPFQRRETWSSLIDDTHGFSLIDNENQNEFIDSFRKFEELDWNAIATDNGLDYKTYNKIKKSKRYFSDNGRKALKNSESLSGTDVLVMWIMVFFMCWDLIWTMSWVMWGDACTALFLIRIVVGCPKTHILLCALCYVLDKNSWTVWLFLFLFQSSFINSTTNSLSLIHIWRCRR